MLPLYQQVRKYLYTLIAKNQLQPDSKLPSERELVERFNSTRITIRQALMRLESLGVVYRANRRGWFVAPKRFVINPTQKVNFNLMANEQGRTPATSVITLKTMSPTETIQAEMDSAASEVFYLCRVRSLEGRQVMAEEIYLDKLRYPGLDEKDLSQSITTLLHDDYAVEIQREYSNIQVVALDKTIADILATNEGAPCLKILRKRYDSSGQLADFNIEYWIHNAIEMEMWAT